MSRGCGSKLTASRSRQQDHSPRNDYDDISDSHDFPASAIGPMPFYQSETMWSVARTVLLRVSAKHSMAKLRNLDDESLAGLSVSSNLSCTPAFFQELGRRA